MLRLKILYGRYRHHLPDLYLDADNEELHLSPPVRDEVARRIKQDFPEQFELIEESEKTAQTPEEEVEEAAPQPQEKPKSAAGRKSRRARKKS